MKTVTLIPKTEKGRQRIERFGEKWTLMADGMFKGSPALLLRSKNDPTNFRWVHSTDDKDFEIKDC